VKAATLALLAVAALERRNNRLRAERAAILARTPALDLRALATIPAIQLSDRKAAP